MKKEVSKLLIIFISIIILTGFISADSCTIRESCESDEFRVMGLSSSTNAHGQVWNASDYEYDEYDYVLCCNFGDEDTDCTGTNKIISLSSETNAHAEIPYPSQGSNYDVNVCYDGLTCVNVPSCESTEGDYPIGVLSLSTWTNAHIGNYVDYDIKICCNKIVCRDEVSLCSHYYYEECDINPCSREAVAYPSAPGDINCYDPTIDCYCVWSGTEEEGSCGFGYEAIDQEGYCGDGIANNPGEQCDCGSDGICEGDDLGDWDCTDYGFTGGNLNCYVPETVDECMHDTSLCTGGTPGICGDGTLNSGEGCDCGGDNCTLIELNSKTCEDFSLLGEELLACYAPTHANNCTFDTTGCESLHPSKIGKCTYDDSTEDNCDDKFLTYNWTATWLWDEDNPEHYDPNGAAEKCVDGYDTVPCPAQIELPFFGSYSIVVIIALIALVYVFLKFKEKEKLKKKPSSKKKKK